MSPEASQHASTLPAGDVATVLHHPYVFTLSFLHLSHVFTLWYLPLTVAVSSQR